MYIQLLIPSSGRTIAHEWIDHHKYGQFFLADAGQVQYQFDDTAILSVNTDQHCFEQCVAMWQDYQLKLKQSDDPNVQQAHANALIQQLNALDSAVSVPGSFWAVILEQVEDGFL